MINVCNKLKLSTSSLLILYTGSHVGEAEVGGEGGEDEVVRRVEIKNHVGKRERERDF